MGHLKLAGEDKEDGNVYGPNKRPKYIYKSDVNNVIKYVTRTKDSNNKEDLVCSSAIGTPRFLGVDAIISSFFVVQEFYRNSSNIGPRVFHEIFWLDDDDVMAINTALDNPLFNFQRFANEVLCACLQVYYNLGYQAVGGFHWAGQSHKPHIHLAINTVNYINGIKWHTDLNGMQDAREEIMNNQFREILFKHASRGM